MYKKEDIFAQLQEMGAPRTGIVLAHTSLRRVGEVEGRGDGLLDALIAYFTEEGGLFCVPTHTWDRTIDAQSGPTMDVSDPHTCIGTLPDLAAARAARGEGVRSLHPTHSMVVFGDRAKAEEFASGEETHQTPVAPDGCYGRIAARGGHILLIGVGHNKDTFLHSLDEMLALPNRLTNETYPATVRTADGRLLACPVYRHCARGIGDVSARYPKYEPAFRAFGAIRDGFIGDAPTQLCDAHKMTAAVRTIWNRATRDLMEDEEPLDEALYKQ